MTSSNEKSFSLYVHVPFCVRKCGYCAFKSAPPTNGDFDAWLSGVERGAERAAKNFRIPLRTIYIGGGTPTILGVREWTKLAVILKNNFNILHDCEFSVEANPESLKNFHIDIWKEMGVSRVSLGVQSLDDDELRFLGRGHDGKMALDAIKKLVDDFDVSADLIFGTSGQTLRSWDYSLRTLLDAGVKHISTYQLTIEPDSAFGKSPPGDLPDGYPFYRYAQWLLPKRGLLQYEIASFAARGHECRHNMAYWRQEDVIALGPSAWGYSEGVRFKNSDDFNATPQIVESLEGDELGREAAILALRMRDGIDCEKFAEKFGRKLLDEIKFRLSDIPENCIKIADEKIALTQKGMRVANQIWEKLL